MTTIAMRNDMHPAPTKIAISLEKRAQLADLLNASLAMAIDLKTQVKHAHWNVTGMEFIAIHELFDRIAADVEEYVDLIAERTTTLGIVALGTARIAAARSTLPEFPLHIHGTKAYLEVIAERVAAFGNDVRTNITRSAEIGDATTSDLYTEISRGLEKQLWFVEAHLRTHTGPSAS